MAALALLALLYSCSSSRHYQRSPDNTFGLYGAVDTSGASMGNTSWQDLFSDPVLDSLIAEGLRNNLDLRSAIQRVLAAEATFNQSRAALVPSLSVQGGSTWVRNSETTNPNAAREYHASQLNLQSSWEVDIWGKLNSAKKAAYASYLATGAAQSAIKTRLIANIALTYYNLLALDSKMQITREAVALNSDLVGTMEVLKDNGNVTGAAVVQSEASRYAMEVTLPDLEQQIRETENTLSLLLGRTPSDIERGKLEEQQVHTALAVGVPSELLDRRPDVVQAEYALISAYEMSNNARAYFYPSLTLTANAGFETLDLEDLFDPKSFAANIVGGLVQPIFNKRANKTRLEVAKAQQEEALLQFKNILLNAGAEVNDALAQYDASVRKMELRSKQLVSLEKSVEYTAELLTYGSANYTEVLIAQQSLLNAQLSEVNDRIQQLSAVVALYRALGGGWR